MNVLLIVLVILSFMAVLIFIIPDALSISLDTIPSRQYDGF